MLLEQRKVISDVSFYRGPNWIKDILSRRNFTLEQSKASLFDLLNPFKLPDMDKAVSFLLKNKESKILTVVDYDTDGISSGVVLSEGLKYLGFTNVETFITKRHVHGYGFSLGVVEYINTKEIKPDIIITADLGSSDGNQFKLLPTISVIVTDHHHISETSPPDSENIVAFINPTRKDIIHEYTAPICGAVVAWNLITALNIKLGKPFDVRTLLDICAVATVGDMMDLSNPSNRAIVKYGVSKINNGDRLAWNTLKKRLGNDKVFTEDVIGFQISPRINALSRMGDSTGLALKWLLTEDLADSYEYLDKISSINEDRKEDQLNCELIAMEMAKKQVEEGAFICICFVDGANHGVVGLSAGKISQRLLRPAIVVARTHKGELTGSARSIPGYDIRSAIVRAQDICGVLKKYGGHAAAAGLSMSSEEDLEIFTKTINSVVKDDFNGTYPIPKLYYDIFLPSEVLTEQGYNLLRTLAPFGQGFPQPNFRVKNKIGEIKHLGKDKKHLRIILERGIEVIWFNKSMEDLEQVTELDTVVTVSFGKFNGRSRYSLIVAN